MSVREPGQYHFAVDDDTAEHVLVVGGSQTADPQVVIGPTVQVVNQRNAPAYFGVPEAFVDAAGADAYATIGVLSRPATNMLISAVTNDALVSLDGGSTDSIFVLAGTQSVLAGLNLPAGTEIQAKNETAASAYANLYISTW